MGRISIAGRVLAGAILAFGGGFPALAGQGMVTGNLTSQPIGHFEFCKARPDECAVRSADKGPAKLTKDLWRRVVAVNKSVNNTIRPMNDSEIYGKAEYWTYPADDVGDCEDYVLVKQRELARAGVSLSNLLITVVRKPDGEGHAVLTLRTSGGDFVLDNLNDDVRQWDATGYRYLKRQSSTDTGRWVSIRSGQAPTVAAVD